MITVRKLQSRDVQALADTFSYHDAASYETLYLEQLQERCQTYVAMDTDELGKRRYYGYITIIWQSDDTHFWQRNIPEISDIFVLPTHRRQGIGTALIDACEHTVRDSGFSKLGIRIEQEQSSIQAFCEAIGYKTKNFSNNNQSKPIHLLKNLDYHT